MPDKFEYEIGGKKYTQKKLVLGQIEQLVDLLENVQLPSDLSARTVVVLLVKDGRMARAASIVFIPEGVELKDKDIDALAAELKFSMDIDTALTVVEDFFDCNPAAAILKRLAGAVVKIREHILKQTGSKTSSASSPEETSQKETPSSGDTP